MDELLQKGRLVTAKTSYGEGIRTATNKERGILRQPTEQVDGQITMLRLRRRSSARRRHRGQGDFPLQARKMYICAMLAPTPPRGGVGLGPAAGGAAFQAVD